MPTTKKKKKKPKIDIPKPPVSPLPRGFKGMRTEDIQGKGKDLWKDDKELDEFLELIRERRKY